jgi:hypothetical protein
MYEVIIPFNSKNYEMFEYDGHHTLCVKLEVFNWFGEYFNGIENNISYGICKILGFRAWDWELCRKPHIAKEWHPYDYVKFKFSHAEDAILFKLTWSGQI